LCNAKMLAKRQSCGTTPDDSDWLKIKVRIGATSWLVSFNIRSEIPSGPIDFLTSSWDSGFSTPGVVTWMSGMSGYNEVLIGNGGVFFHCED